MLLMLRSPLPSTNQSATMPQFLTHYAIPRPCRRDTPPVSPALYIMLQATLQQGLPDEQLREIFAQLGFVTECGSMTPILRQAFKAASVSDATILLEGETGTGKQILAGAIHRLDKKRAHHPFVTVHCGGISEALSESEFFGHRRGSFTGAVTDRSGLFQVRTMERSCSMI